MIKKLSNNQGVRKSSTLGGQRELIREMRKKINEIIDAVTLLQTQMDSLLGTMEEPMMEPMMDHSEDKLEMISDCCGAPIHTSMGDEGTNFYYCEKCGDACNSREPIKEKAVDGECDHEWGYALPRDKAYFTIPATCKKCGVGYLEQDKSTFISKKEIKEAIEGVYNINAYLEDPVTHPISRFRMNLLSKLNLEEI